ncbi:MAG: chemotaxis protein CheA, partial [Leptonema sp. (in: Bacteria)]|nr:chemotaxis protein CheA [Leptonema sp. (in: bacteria)]
MSNNQDRYVELFLDEAAEHIENLNTNLLSLEKDHHDPEIINEIFRSAHTLKSSAAFVGLETFSHLAHKMEDLFQKIREGSIQVNTNLVNLLFSCLDRIKQAVAVIQNGSMPTDSYADLISEIETFLAQNQSTSKDDSTIAKPEIETKSIEPNKQPESDIKTKQILLTDDQKNELRKLAAGKSVYHGYVSIDEDAPMKNMRFLLLLSKLNRIGTIFISDPMAIDLEEGAVTDNLLFIYYGTEKKDVLFNTCQIDMVEEIYIVELSLADEKTTVDENNNAKPIERKPELNLQETHLKTRNIKVSSDKIDYLLNNVGELVITNSGLLKIYEDLSNEFGESSLLGELKSRIDQAGRIARDLQTGIMKTRMIPIGIVFQRFQRPVRDLALSLGKEIELHTEGEDTELDKNIIDALNDPLLHLIRNALDHGIEPREDRIKAGKDPLGHITLKAYQSGNSIFVEIRDDGRGLNRQKLLEKGIQKGLVDPTAIPTDEEIFNMIFLPGFSTAQQVSDLSGRGVGMNVVRQMVSEFKGTVQVQNSAGNGSAFILTFPLTLAIISAILVNIAGEEYAFPLSDVVETIRINKSEITRLQGKNIINLRNEIVPVFRLSQLMG